MMDAAADHSPTIRVTDTSTLSDTMLAAYKQAYISFATLPNDKVILPRRGEGTYFWQSDETLLPILTMLGLPPRRAISWEEWEETARAGRQNIPLLTVCKRQQCLEFDDDDAKVAATATAVTSSALAAAAIAIQRARRARAKRTQRERVHAARLIQATVRTIHIHRQVSYTTAAAMAIGEWRFDILLEWMGHTPAVSTWVADWVKFHDNRSSSKLAGMAYRPSTASLTLTAAPTYFIRRLQAAQVVQDAVIKSEMIQASAHRCSDEAARTAAALTSTIRVSVPTCCAAPFNWIEDDPMRLIIRNLNDLDESLQSCTRTRWLLDLRLVSRQFSRIVETEASIAYKGRLRFFLARERFFRRPPPCERDSGDAIEALTNGRAPRGAVVPPAQ